jgi:hypothetical protein
MYTSSKFRDFDDASVGGTSSVKRIMSLLQLRLKELLGTNLDIEVYDYIEGVIREYEGFGVSIEDVRYALWKFSIKLSKSLITCMI